MHLLLKKLDCANMWSCGLRCLPTGEPHMTNPAYVLIIELMVATFACGVAFSPRRSPVVGRRGTHPRVFAFCCATIHHYATAQ